MAYAGNGTSHFDLCDRRLIHFGIIRICGFYWDGGSGGSLLNGCRMAFDQAVRLAKEKFGRSRSGKTEVYAPTQPDLRGIQCYLLDTNNTRIYVGNKLPNRDNIVFRNYHPESSCQSVQE